MAAVRLKVTFDNEREVEVAVTPRAQVNTERFLKGIEHSNAVQASVRLAYESLLHRRLIESSVGYEEFIDSILDVEELEDNATTSENPTNEAPSPTPSSD